MRKTLAIVLTVIMVLSLALVGVSAADATVIKTAEEFAAMAADGNYKLGADITIAASYGVGETIVPFCGTLDGDGHTVTTTVPVFAQLSTNACVKNLIIGKAGDQIVYADSTHCGALARDIAKSSTNVVIENVTNNCDITAVATGSWRRGGLIGQIFDAVEATFVGCTNNGKVLGGNMIGGLVGYIQGSKVSFTDCVNTGDVSIDIASSLTGLAAGIVGRFGGDNAYAPDTARSITITNCLNTGAIFATTQAAGILAHIRGCNVAISYCTNKGAVTSGFSSGTSGSSDAAGILGSTGGEKGYYAMITVDRCDNYGAVSSANARAAGIIGYVWCGNYSSNYLFAKVTNCVNRGAVSGGSFVSQIFAYTNDTRNTDEGTIKDTAIKDCVGLGSVSRSTITTRVEEKYYGSVLGFSSATVPENYDVKLTLVENDGTKYFSYTETAANAVSIMELGTQRAGLVTIATAAQAEAAAAALGLVGYTAPVIETPVVDDPATGDSILFVALAALVSVLGMGVAFKARKD